MTETWIIITYHQNYSVSNLGKIKNSKTGRILKQNIRSGYLAVSFSTPEKQVRKYNIHIIVANTFIRSILQNEVVNHIDGNKLNNNVENLEIVSYRMNSIHARDNKLVNYYKRQVVQYDLSYNIVNIYESISFAEHSNTFPKGYIGGRCRNEINQSGIYIWKFLENNSTIINKSEFNYISGFDNYLASEKGIIINKHSNRQMKYSNDNTGYLCLKMTKNDGNRIKCLVHRIIALVFCPNPQNHKYVNHIDRNKHNNNLINLEWVTQQQNIQHNFKLTE